MAFVLPPPVIDDEDERASPELMDSLPQKRETGDLLASSPVPNEGIQVPTTPPPPVPIDDEEEEEWDL